MTIGRFFFGAGSGFTGRVQHLTLPVLVLGIHGMGFVMRITRAAMLNQLEQDFIPFARARGVGVAPARWAWLLQPPSARPALVGSVALLVAGAGACALLGPCGRRWGWRRVR